MIKKTDEKFFKSRHELRPIDTDQHELLLRLQVGSRIVCANDLQLFGIIPCNCLETPFSHNLYVSLYIVQVVLLGF
jgi:hypothetical protein